MILLYGETIDPETSIFNFDVELFALIQKNITSTLPDNVETRYEGAKSKELKFLENLNVPPNFEPLVPRNY